MKDPVHTCGKVGGRQTDDRLCKNCAACDPHRQTHRIAPLKKLPYGVDRCTHCDGPDAHNVIRTSW